MGERESALLLLYDAALLDGVSFGVVLHVQYARNEWTCFDDGTAAKAPSTLMVTWPSCWTMQSSTHCFLEWGSARARSCCSVMHRSSSVSESLCMSMATMHAMSDRASTAALRRSRPAAL